MDTTIKSVFQSHATHLRFDAALVKAISSFERGFVNGNEEHIAFFGGYSMGVHKMRFRGVDRESWFNDVLRMNEQALEEDIAQLSSIDPEWVRASDAMNLSCAWLAYELLHATSLPQAVRHEAAVQVIQVMLYKFMGSLMAHNFKYSADEASMTAMYAELNYKYAIKKAGSWGRLLRERAEELVSPQSVHRPVFEQFDSDDGIVRMINDTQSRLRQIVKSMNKVFYDVRARGVKIGTTKSVLDIDGESVLLDKTRKYSTYIRYLTEVLGDRKSFVRKELMDVVRDMMHTMSPRMFEDTLVWMSVHRDDPKHPQIRELCEETLIFAFEQLSTHRDRLARNHGLSPLLKQLRALYMASRMPKDSPLHRCKEMAEEIVVKATGSRSSSSIAAVRTGLQLYICVRSLAMHYYQG
jgi:hypothetical protein